MSGIDFRLLNQDRSCDGLPKGKYIYWRYARHGWKHYIAISAKFKARGSDRLAELARLKAASMKTG